MGSVKDLELIVPAFENKPGSGDFVFSDRFSVFDWGEMPDQIRNKGRALAVMSAFNFEQLQQRGISTHYMGLVVDGKLVNFEGLVNGENGSDRMRVAMAVRYDPVARRFISKDEEQVIEYDYNFFNVNRGKIDNYLVPLEIIFRNGLPRGSSVFKNLKAARGDSEKTRDILSGLGLTEIPKEGNMLPRSVMNYTTKLEAGDRNLSEHEAYMISGLSQEKFREIAPLALRVNDYVSDRAIRTGLAPHWDGKVEMIYVGGNLALADVVGTLDEDRFGDRISKEFIRQWYEVNQPEWRQACEVAKKTGKGWQERCPIKPINLPTELTMLVSQMYMAACNQYVERKIFPDVPALDTVMQRLKPYRD